MNTLWLRAAALVLPLCLALGSGIARADAASEIAELMRDKQWPEADKRIEAELKVASTSPQWRLMKSQVLAAQGQHTLATAALQALTQEFPELPEPYNNLAVLLAAQGLYEPALIALQSALRARPDYKTAQQNLGDLYTALAQQAYFKAKALPHESALTSPPGAATSTTSTTTRALR